MPNSSGWFWVVGCGFGRIGGVAVPPLSCISICICICICVCEKLCFEKEGSGLRRLGWWGSDPGLSLPAEVGRTWGDGGRSLDRNRFSHSLHLDSQGQGQPGLVLKTRQQLNKFFCDKLQASWVCLLCIWPKLLSSSERGRQQIHWTDWSEQARGKCYQWEWTWPSRKEWVDPRKLSKPTTTEIKDKNWRVRVFPYGQVGSVG